MFNPQYYFRPNAFKPFIFKVNSTITGSTPSTQFAIPTTGTGYNYNVKVDGVTVATNLTGNYTINGLSGVHTIEIGGKGFPRIFFNSTGDRSKITELLQFGDYGKNLNGTWNNTHISAFYGCNNLNCPNLVDTPTFLTKTTGILLSRFFAGCTTLNNVNGIGSWNTSSVTDMSSMFSSATNFNQNISSWNTSAVTTMASVFQSATNFNQNISSWNTSAVTNMSNMFASNNSFNQNIGSWNVSNVTTFLQMFYVATAFNNGGSVDINNWNLKNTGTVNMSGMFSSATNFNQNIGSWNTSAVTDMSSMFKSATNFNQNIGGWNTQAVTNMSSMFDNADSFNQPLNSWNTSAVTNMSDMFASNNSFNQNIGSWNVSNVTTFLQMFYVATAFNNGGSVDINNWNLKNTGTVSLYSMFASSKFNQPIGNWNVTNVTNMEYMFWRNSTFNQPLSNWERVGSTLANVTSVQEMFESASAFNQDIGNWNLDSVINFVNFMESKTGLNYTTTNMDSILNGWILNELSPSESINFGTIKRSAVGTEGYNLLTRTNTTKTVTNAVNNGSGLIRITATSHGLSTGNKCFIKSILGTTEANGLATITVIDPDTFDIQGSTFTNTYISGGTVIAGYGWTITGATL